MTISQQIAKSLRTGSQARDENEDEDIFDIDQHLQSASQKILLERVNFVVAKFPYHFNLKQLKSKYVNLNPRGSESSSSSAMTPALKSESASSSVSSLHDGIPIPKTIIFSPESVELSWRNAMRVGAGLFNLGNTCFMNSSLQCLTYTAPLANYLTHMDHQRNCRSNGQFCMLCAMQKHLKNTWSHSGQSIKPSHILQNLRMIAKHMQFGRQEDAHEFIRYSVDAMQKACLIGYPSKLDVHVKATTAVHQIFGGYLRSRVKCSQCKSVSDTFDPFLDLSLEINKQGCCSLQNCLEMFVRVEILQGDNAYKCMRCKNTVTACKKFSIHRAPNVLMLQLKRFSNFMGNKINKSLSYPSKLNLAPYMSMKQNGGLWYELYAVLVHSGFSCQSGHYYSYAKAPNGQWYCFNDSSVYQVGINQVLNQQAYLLFYSRNKKAQNGHFKNGHNLAVNGKNTQPDTAPNETRQSKDFSGKSHATVIGPQLPPELKKKVDHSKPTTSANSIDSASKQAKRPNEDSQRKISNGLNDRTKSVSFVVNRKPKLIIDHSSKILSKGKTTGNVSKPQPAVVSTKTKVESIEKPSTSIEKCKAKDSSSNGDRSSILNQLLRDSVVQGKSTTSMKKSSSALQALNAYSSTESESDEEDVTNKNKSSYSTLTSTLATLRKSGASTSKKLVSDSSKTLSSSKFQENNSKPVKSNGLSKISTQKTASLNNSTRNNGQVANSQREPILQVLSSEMKTSEEKNVRKGDGLKKSSIDTSNHATAGNRKRHHSDEPKSSGAKYCKITSNICQETGKSEHNASRRLSGDHDTVHVKDGGDRKRNHSATNHRSQCKDINNSNHHERDIEKLYRDKKQYEHSLRKKAKKEKKLRLENLQARQNCIEENDSEQCHEDETKPLEKTHPATLEKQTKPVSPEDRPNVLGQLLQQSSERAYGVKVDSWDGADSVVENDAKSTYAELTAPVLDDWNREYDKGKVKKVKKEPRSKNANTSSNIFQKFQNFKNERKH